MGFWERKILERGVKREKDFEKKKTKRNGGMKNKETLFENQGS
jgi:hypothetical protein